MFRGKESSNRIELSRLVQELLILVFSAPCGLWGHGWLGVPPTHVHMHAHAHARTCMHGKHDNSCKWPPPLDLGKSWGFPMMSYTCVHACAHV